MSPTFHRTADATEYFKLPLEILSEENFEDYHQIKKKKSPFCRKVSCMKYNIMVRYLMETDPRLRGQTAKDKPSLPPEFLKLLKIHTKFNYICRITKAISIFYYNLFLRLILSLLISLAFFPKTTPFP